jgi:hypothetical protein
MSGKQTKSKQQSKLLTPALDALSLETEIANLDRLIVEASTELVNKRAALAARRGAAAKALA